MCFFSIVPRCIGKCQVKYHVLYVLLPPWLTEGGYIDLHSTRFPCLDRSTQMITDGDV